LIDYLSRSLGVAKRDIRIVSGLSSRRKVIDIDGLTATQVDAALDQEPF